MTPKPCGYNTSPPRALGNGEPRTGRVPNTAVHQDALLVPDGSEEARKCAGCSKRGGDSPLIYHPGRQAGNVEGQHGQRHSTLVEALHALGQSVFHDALNIRSPLSHWCWLFPTWNRSKAERAAGVGGRELPNRLHRKLRWGRTGRAPDTDGVQRMRFEFLAVLGVLGHDALLCSGHLVRSNRLVPRELRTSFHVAADGLYNPSKSSEAEL